MVQFSLLFAAISGALGVILGAFGAHALKSTLTAAQLQTWQTAVQYQFIHVLALLLCAIIIRQWGASIALSSAAVAFAIGIIFFSGSLYWLALGGPKWLGPITPLGGLTFIVGWLSLAFAALKINA